MDVDVSPFPHHGPLPPDQVTGRDELVNTLLANLTARRPTALLGPRRYGKTSVLGRVGALLGEASTSVLFVDLFEVTSIVDLALRFDGALEHNRSRFGELARRVAASLEITLGMVKLAFAKPDRPDPAATLHVLLDIVVQSALEAPTVLVLDEFSSIGKVAGAAGLLRTKLQHHFGDIGLVFAGSEPSTMRTLFAAKEQPFFGQAELLVIEPLSAVAVNDLVVAGFVDTDRDPGELPGLIHRFCGGHPRRTMQTADMAWRRAAPGAPYQSQLWVETVEALEQATDDANEVLYASFNDSEKKVLRILASDGSLYGRAAELLGLNPTPARGALANLVDGGHVHDGRLVDPFLASWLRRRLPL